MRHVLRLHGVVVGWSDLEQAEPELGRARGRFRPAFGYELIQPVFRLYAEAVERGRSVPHDGEKLERYHRSRDALQLELQDDAGHRIATNAIHIADYSAGSREDIELDVLIADEGYWKRRQ